MATTKKTKSAATKRAPKGDVKGKKHGKVPTDKEFEQKMELARRIYNEETEGIVFIMEMKKEEKGIRADGLLRVWNAPRHLILRTLAKQMNVSSLEMLLVASEME